VTVFTADTKRRKAPWVLLGLILIATVWAYCGVTANGFVWDDEHTVANNPAIASLSLVGSWFLPPSPNAMSLLNATNYRPVLVTSYAIDHALWGADPSGYHLTSLGVHLAVVVLVFLLARRLWGLPSAAVAAALLAAVHPINAEAVNYISARSSSLMTVMVLAAVWQYDRVWGDPAVGGAQPSWKRLLRLGVALALGLMALGAKEAAAVLPVLVIVWDRARRGNSETWRVTLARSLPWWGIVVVFLGVRAWVFYGALDRGRPEEAWGQVVLFSLKIALTSVAGWLWPAGLAIDHGWPWTIGPREGVLLVMGGIGVALATWGMFRLDRRMGWCVAWFWVALIPLAALPVVSRLTLYQDHRVYLGGVGLAWLFGRVAVTGANALRPFRAIRVAAWLGAGAVIAAALVADTARTAVWSDADRLWDDVIEQYPGSILGANHVGLRYLSADELDRAREIFERSASTEPRFPMTHNYLGIVYAKLGQRDRAIAEFETAVRLNPYYATARLNLGNAYEQSQRPDLALDAYERGLPDGPWAVATLQRSARLLERQGRFDEARERYRRILDAERNAEGRK
jgi:hypothetical protein